MAELTNVSVLLVEPDADTRALYTMCLEAAGAVVDAVADATDAMARLQASAPDCVVTELALPRITGAELCRRILRTYGRRVPVLVVTALAGAYYVADVKLAGAARVLSKPCMPDDLVATVMEMTVMRAEAAAQSAHLRRAVRSLLRARALEVEPVPMLDVLDEAADADVPRIGTLCASPAETIDAADATACELIGLPIARLRGRPLWDLCPAGKKEEYRLVWQWFLRSGRLHGAAAVMTAGGVRTFQYESASDPARGGHVFAFAPHPTPYRHEAA